MSGLFAGASFFNGIMSNWNVSSVKYINSMFYQAAAFNQDISSWDVRSVTNSRSETRSRSIKILRAGTRRQLSRKAMRTLKTCSSAPRRGSLLTAP